MVENAAGADLDVDHAPDTFYGLAKCFSEDLGKLYWAKLTVVWGVSNNDRAPVDNSKAAFLGYHPKDNAENWAETLYAAAQPADPSDQAQLRLGGPFATIPLGESGVAAIKAMSDAAATDQETKVEVPVETAPQTLNDEQLQQPDATTPPVAETPNAPKLPSFLTKKSMNP